VFSFFCPAHCFSECGGNGLLDFPKPVSEHSVSPDISLCHGALWEAVVDQDANLILGDAKAHSEGNEGVAKHRTFFPFTCFCCFASFICVMRPLVARVGKTHGDFGYSLRPAMRA